MKLENIYKTLCEIRNKKDKLVLFVGSGISKNVEGYVDWQGLVRKMAEKLNLNSNSKFSNDELLRIPEYLYNSDKEEYFRILNDCFNKNTNDESCFSKLFMDIAPQHIITTNYDKLIERHPSFKSDYYDVVYDDKTLYESNYNHHVIKMHGDIENISSIVLKEKDYLDYSDNHKLIETFIKALMVDHYFIFCGYSINDYNVKMMINWFNNINSNSNRIFGYILTDDATSNDTIYFLNKGVKVIDYTNIPNLGLDLPLKKDKGINVYNYLYLVRHNELDEKFFSENLNESIDNYLKKIKYTNVKSLLLKYGISGSVNANILVVSSDMKNVDYLFENSQEFHKMLSKNRIVSIQDVMQKTRHIISPLYRFEGIEFIKMGYLNDYKGVFNSVLSPLTIKYYEEEISKHSHSNFFNNYLDVELVDDFENMQYYISRYNDALNAYNNSLDLKVIKSEIKNFIEVNNIYNFFDLYIDVGTYDAICINYLHNIKEHLQNLNTMYTYGGDYHHFSLLQSIVYNYYFISHTHGIKTFDGNLNRINSTYFKAICLYSSDLIDNPISSKYSRINKYELNYLDIDIICKNLPTGKFLEVLREGNVQCFEFQHVDFDALINNYIHSFNSIEKFSNISALINYFFLIGKSKVNLNEITQKNIIDFFVSYKEAFDDPLVNRNLIIALNVVLDGKAKSSKLIEIIKNSKEYEAIIINLSCDTIKQLFNNIVNYNDDLTKLICLEILDDIKKDLKVIYAEIYIFYDILAIHHKDEIDLFLSSNVFNISPILLQYYVYNNIIDFDVDIANNIITYIKEHKYNQNIYTIPNHYQEKIDILIYYALNGKIKDYKIFKPIVDKSPYLKFLFEPNDFDWESIDFSYEMWVSIFESVVSEDLLNKHYKSLKKNIIERKKLGISTGYENYIYYRYFGKKETS